MTLHNTASRETNALAALDSWYRDQECTILTDNVAFIVGTAGIDSLPPQWQMTSPEQIEAEFSA